MKPRGPNENTKAIEVVNGGEISGSNVATSSSRTANRRALRPFDGEGEQEAEQRAAARRPASRATGCCRSARRLLWLLDGGYQRRQGEAAVVAEGARPAASSSG